jgi:hypothetical protein
VELQLVLVKCWAVVGWDLTVLPSDDVSGLLEVGG